MGKAPKAAAKAGHSLLGDALAQAGSVLGHAATAAGHAVTGTGQVPAQAIHKAKATATTTAHVVAATVQHAPAHPGLVHPAPAKATPGSPGGKLMAPPARPPGRSSAGPTDAHHDWIHKMFGVDMRGKLAAALPSAGAGPLRASVTAGASITRPGANLAAAAAPPPGMMKRAWTWTKEEASAAAGAVGRFDEAHGHVVTRAAGALQTVAAIGEGTAGLALAGVGSVATATGVGAPPGTLAVAGGTALAVNAVDNAWAGLKTAVTGEFQHTVTAQAAGGIAHASGASDSTVERVTNGMDLAQGLAGGGGAVAVGRTVVRREAAAGLRLAEQKAAQAEARHVAEMAAAKDMAERKVAEGQAKTMRNVAERRARATAEEEAERAAYQTYTDELRRNMVRPHTTDPKLSELMNELYRENAKVGSGSTAAAVRAERATGQAVGGAFHDQKAREMVGRLKRWLREADKEASKVKPGEKVKDTLPWDRAAAENVIRDMEDALESQ